MIRLAAIILTLVMLIAVTGVRVVALWPQHSPMAPPEPVVPLSEPASVKSLSGSFVVKPELSLLQRLEHRLQRSPADYEASLLRGLLLFQEGDIDEAIQQLRLLTRQAPRFELAHLVLGDLLSARFVPIDTIGSMSSGIQVSPAQTQRLEELRSEARARLRGYLSLLHVNQIPRSLISLGEDRLHALVIDKSKNRLYVYRNRGPESPPQLVDDFYIVLGRKVGDKMFEGDLKTPTGTYFVTSYLAPESLPPLYGSGAFPINYPNEYDRRQKKSGFGIWLHGTDRSLFSRPPLDSEGCVVLTNEEFDRIRQYVVTGLTPVVISEELEWLSEGDWLKQKNDIKTTLEQWRQSWENGDLEAYLQMYAEDFWTSQHDYRSWGLYKKQIFAGKTFQKIALSDLSLFEYPRSDQQPPLIVANFVQHYRSNNFNGDMRKRLYLVKEQEGWKVLYEGQQ